MKTENLVLAEGCDFICFVDVMIYKAVWKSCKNFSSAKLSEGSILPLLQLCLSYSFFMFIAGIWGFLFMAVEENSC